MINFDDVIEEGTIRQHNPNWPQIPDHPCRNNNWRLWSSAKNSLFNLINQQPDIDENLFRL